MALQNTSALPLPWNLQVQTKFLNEKKLTSNNYHLSKDPILDFEEFEKSARHLSQIMMPEHKNQVSKNLQQDNDFF